MYSSLYHTLITNEDFELDNDQIKRLRSYINRLRNNDTIRHVYLLLVEHYYQTEQKFKEFPYESQQKEKGFSFDIENLPEELQKILWNFFKHQTSGTQPKNSD